MSIFRYSHTKRTCSLNTVKYRYPVIAVSSEFSVKMYFSVKGCRWGTQLLFATCALTLKTTYMPYMDVGVGVVLKDPRLCTPGAYPVLMNE